MNQSPHQVVMETGNSQPVLDFHFWMPEAQQVGGKWIEGFTKGDTVRPLISFRCILAGSFD